MGMHIRGGISRQTTGIASRDVLRMRVGRGICHQRQLAGVSDLRLGIRGSGHAYQTQDNMSLTSTRPVYQTWHKTSEVE